MKHTFLHSNLHSLFKKVQFILSATWCIYMCMSISPCNPCPCHCYS